VAWVRLFLSERVLRRTGGRPRPQACRRGPPAGAGLGVVVTACTSYGARCNNHDVPRGGGAGPVTPGAGGQAAGDRCPAPAPGPGGGQGPGGGRAGKVTAGALPRSAAGAPGRRTRRAPAARAPSPSERATPRSHH